MNKVALILLLTILSVSAHGNHNKKVVHECMHDEMDFSNLVPNDYLENFEENYGDRKLQTSTPQPIRITIDFKELDNPANGEGLTPNIKQYLKNIMYAAQVYLNKLIKVYPRTKPIKMTWGDTCYDIKVTQEIQTVGIDNSDIHIYVTYSNEPNTTYLANAIWCQLDPQPIVGRVKFNIGVMNIDESSTQAFQDNFSTSLHEILHILGFSGSSVSYWIDPDTGKPYGSENAYKVMKRERRWEKDNVNKVFSKNILRVSRNHYACPSIDGMYLENQGGGGSMGSHWERDLLGNEFMTASIVYGVYTISEFTAALLLDTGYYAEINSNLLMPIYWGKNKGCDFFNKSCNTGKYFPEYPDESVKESCDFFSQGMGNLANYDYFSQCNKIQTYSNAYCEDSEQFKPDERLRQNTGAGSRCFRSNANRKGDEIQDMKGRCFKSKCAKDLSSIEVNVWGEEYVTCKYPNQIINLGDNNKGTQGTMKCPDDFDLFCNFPKSCSNNCSNNGVCNNGYCICLKGWSGEDCSKPCPEGQAWDGTRCVYRCPAGQFKNLDNTCKTTCPYKQYGDSNTGSCELCSVNCSACYGSGINQCLSCNNGYILSGNQCVDINCHSSCQSCSGSGPNQCTSCPMGKYLDANKSCQTCQSPCETCSTATQCTSCSDGFYMDKFSGKCVSNNTCDSSCLSCSEFRDPTKCTSCRDGQFINQEGRCQRCDDSCAKCSGSDDKCIECTKGYEYDAQNKRCYLNCHTTCNECTAANDPNACKYCAAGYTMKNKVCVPCDKNCYTCEGEPYLCTQCERGFKLDEQYKTCKPICKTGEFQDRDGSCKTCTAPCATCLYYDNYCSSCISGYTLNRSYCEPNNQTCHSSCATCRQYNDPRQCETCRDGMYLYNGQCLACSSNCATCSRNAQTCTSCMSGQFLSNGQCLTCDASCLTCSGIAQKCTSCREGFMIDSKSGLCVSSTPACKSNEYLDRSNQCKPCTAPCASCQYYSDRCTSCISGYQLNSQQFKCDLPVPTCKSGEFLDQNNQCKPCASPCATCQYQSNRCTSCISNYTLNGNSCEAPVKQCHASCATCSRFEDPTACTSCKFGQFLGKDGRCQACSSNCAQCIETSDKCTQCLNGFILDANTKKCVAQSQKCHPSCSECTAPNDANACEACNTGFFLYNNACIACESSCKTCDRAEYNCTSCREGDTFDSRYGSCTPNCKPGQFLDRNNQCSPCASPCGSCEFYEDRCTSCVSGYEFNKDYFSCKIICKQGEYVDQEDKCKPCSAPCATCEYYDNRCLSCVSGYTYNNYYCEQNSRSSVRGCHDSCNTCYRSMDPRACDSCREGYALVSGQCQKKRGNYTQPKP